MATVRSQYYLTNALVDVKRAFRLNEDIALASVIIAAVISFSAISLLANTIYAFMLAAHWIAESLGASMVPLVLLACGVLTVLAGWLLALLQNALSIALMEGATRKQKRSLIATFRKSLRYASRTASAWFALFMMVFGPVGMATLTALAIIYFGNVPLASSVPYLIALAVTSAAWIVWAFASFTLAPYVMLFENIWEWSKALKRSRQLVRRKGRVFIISCHLAFVLALAGLYFVSQLVEKITHIDHTLTFLLLGVGAAFVANTLLTMLYRKRKLARK